MKKALLTACVALALVLALAAPLRAGESRFMHHSGYMARLAHCESTHRWQHWNGGGLQIVDSTWRAFGGRQFASVAERATVRQQKKVGWRIKRDGWRGTPPQGDEAWPYCGDAVKR